MRAYKLKYIVIENTNVNDVFESAVNQYYAEGYRPVGGVAIKPEHHGVHYVQAMELKEVPDIGEG